jgi:predicted TIM-barrel fold metal-dependent hydrolase
MTQNLDGSRRDFLSTSSKVLLGGVLSGLPADSGVAAGSGLSPARGKYPIIDCHAHVGIERLAGTDYDLTDPWDTVADPEIIVRHAAEVGIDRTVIFPIENLKFEEANKEVADIVRRYPGRFIGFAKHDPVNEKGEIRALLFREVRELGLRGLKLHVQPTPEVLDAVKELGIPVLYHPLRVALFEEFVPSYPTVNFILAHMGSDTSANWHEQLAAIELAKRYQNVHLDTSASCIAELFERAFNELPPQQILFGSDEVELDCRVTLERIRVLKLPAESEELILGGNILRLLGGRL